jgi:subtilisin family serine protease
MPFRLPHRPGSPSLRRSYRPTLEGLEQRTLLSTTPLPAPTGVSVSSSAYSDSDILVQYRTNKPQSLLAGTTVGPQLSLVNNLYEVNLSKGVSVAQALAAYKASASVTLAEPDYVLTATTTAASSNQSQQWALTAINATGALNVTTGTPSVIVAVADTGIDYDDVDLYDNIWINQAAIPASRLKNLVDVDHDGYISFADLNNPINQGPGKITDLNGDGRIDAADILQPMVLNAQGQDTGLGGWVNPNVPDAADGLVGDLIGWNYSANTDSPLDDNDHGTHVAGIIGAMGASGGTIGVDPNVLLMPIKFLDASGHGTISQYIQGLDYAVSHGAKIVNNSWTGADPSQALSDAIANAQSHGVIFVAAAGNDSSNNDTSPVYPASYDQSFNNVVTVAATDTTGALASFSNYGAKSVNIAAPGVNILSTLPGNTYGTLSGTSMATPMVTGVLALVWSEHPSWSYTQVINQVLSTVTKESSLAGKVSSGGLLNAAAAVGAPTSTNASPVILSTNPSGPTVNSLSTVQVTFNRPMNPATFTPADVTLLGPGGLRIAPLSVTAVAGSNNTSFDINLSAQTASGTYTLYIGSNAQDLQGNRLNLYQGSFTIPAGAPAGPPHVVSTNPSGPTVNSLSTVTVTFDRPMNPATLTTADVTLLGPGGLRIAPTSVTPVAGSGNTSFNINLSTQTAAGTYSLYIGSNALDTQGNRLTLYQGSFTIAASSTPPTNPPPASPSVVSAVPAGGTPANSLSVVQVTFNTAISLSSFTPADVTLLGPGGLRLSPASVQVVANSGDKVFNLTFAAQTAGGTYTLYIGSNATDLLGNAVALYEGNFTISSSPTTTHAA